MATYCYRYLLSFHSRLLRLSGVDPNWRHMIPPRQSHVVSEGYCVGACTKAAFNESENINIFAALAKMSFIGKQLRVRHVSKQYWDASLSSMNLQLCIFSWTRLHLGARKHRAQSCAARKQFSNIFPRIPEVQEPNSKPAGWRSNSGMCLQQH